MCEFECLGPKSVAFLLFPVQCLRLLHLLQRKGWHWLHLPCFSWTEHIESKLWLNIGCYARLVIRYKVFGQSICHVDLQFFGRVWQKSNLEHRTIIFVVLHDQILYDILCISDHDTRIDQWTIAEETFWTRHSSKFMIYYTVLQPGLR